jgi:hypothetical protein
MNDNQDNNLRGTAHILISNTEIDRIEVGEMPNGISIWNKDMGGTP